MRPILPVLLVLLTFVASNSYGEEAKRLPLRKTEAQEEKNYPTNELLKSALELSSFRHKVLSQNMANLNTPGYKADEVDAPTQYQDLTGKGSVSRRIRLAKTATSHLDGKQKTGGKFNSHKLKDPYEIKPNGNNVSLPQQMTKISQNQQEYGAALNSYGATNALISTVLGK